VVLLVGPNGAGKSTVAPLLLQGALQVQEFVNADVIARGLSEFRPESIAIEAGKVMLARLRDLAARRIDFAFETTLASRTFAPWIEELIREGYEFSLLFLWLSSVDEAVARVKERIRAGGHSVPDEVIIRRYTAGLRNFFRLYRDLAMSWRFYDNGASVPRLIAIGSGRIVTSVQDPQLWSAIEEAHGPAA
jgi:predicted ABC-type ATPase